MGDKNIKMDISKLEKKEDVKMDISKLDKKEAEDNNIQKDLDFDEAKFIITKNKWNWGAFFLAPVWAIVNKKYKALITLIPIIGFIYSFFVAKKANSWAWENKNWKSKKSYLKSVRRWNVAGFIYLFIMFLGFIGAASEDSNANVSSNINETKSEVSIKVSKDKDKNLNILKSYLGRDILEEEKIKELNLLVKNNDFDFKIIAKEMINEAFINEDFTLYQDYMANLNKLEIKDDIYFSYLCKEFGKLNVLYNSNKNMQEELIDIDKSKDVINDIEYIEGYVNGQIQMNGVLGEIADSFSDEYAYDIRKDREYNAILDMYLPGEQKAVLKSKEPLFEESGTFDAYIVSIGEGDYIYDSFEVKIDEYRLATEEEIDLSEKYYYNQEYFESIENEYQENILYIDKIKSNMLASLSGGYIDNTMEMAIYDNSSYGFQVIYPRYWGIARDSQIGDGASLYQTDDDEVEMDVRVYGQVFTDYMGNPYKNLDSYISNNYEGINQIKTGFISNADESRLLEIVTEESTQRYLLALKGNVLYTASYVVQYDFSNMNFSFDLIDDANKVIDSFEIY